MLTIRPAPYAPSASGDETLRTAGGVLSSYPAACAAASPAAGESRAAVHSPAAPVPIRISREAESDPGAPGAGSVRLAAFPEPSMISLPLACSAPVPLYRRTGADSHGGTRYENLSTGDPDPDSYRACRPSPPPTARARNGLPVTVTASVNLTMASTRSPDCRLSPPPAPRWWYTLCTAGGSLSSSNSVKKLPLKNRLSDTYSRSSPSSAMPSGLEPWPWSPNSSTNRPSLS